MSPHREAQRERLLELAHAGDLVGLRQLLEELHPSDVADLVESLEDDDRVLVLRALPTELASETLAEMEEEEDRAELLASLQPEEGAELLHELPDDDAADLIGELSQEVREQILAALPSQEAGELRKLVRYDEETAGGLMTTALVSIRSSLTAQEAIDEVRRQGREVEDFYSLFVVDDRQRLLGTVPLDDMILADPGEPVATLVEPTVASVLPDVDQEEVGRLIAKYNLVAIPVINESGTLLGRITFDDVIDVIEAETTEDILRLAGVSEEEELRGDWSEAVKSRLPWLTLNLGTATAAATVVLLFERTIQEITFLAFLMPVIAAMGGNAGTQALAVTIRRIAVTDPTAPPRRSTAVRKEILVGLLNGLFLGVLFAGLSYLFRGDAMLGLVVLLAMWVNLIVAGFAGAFIPTVLHRLGVDPAIASSVFVHTLTDLFGFFLLLGLASALLL